MYSVNTRHALVLYSDMLPPKLTDEEGKACIQRFSGCLNIPHAAVDLRTRRKGRSQGFCSWFAKQRMGTLKLYSCVLKDSDHLTASKQCRWQGLLENHLGVQKRNPKNNTYSSPTNMRILDK